MITIGWTLFLFFASYACDSIVELAGNETIQVDGTNKISLGYSIEFMHNMKASKNSIQSLAILGLKPLLQEERLFQNATLYYHPTHFSPRWIYYQTSLQNGEDLDHKAWSNFHAFMFLDAISEKLPIPVVPAAFALPKIDREHSQFPSILQPEVPNSVPFVAATSFSYQTRKRPRKKGSLHRALLKSRSSVSLVLNSFLNRSQENDVMGQAFSSNLDTLTRPRKKGYIHKALSKSRSSVSLVLKTFFKRSQDNNVMGQANSSNLDIPIKFQQLKRVEILTYICRLYWLSRFMGLEEHETEFEGWFVHTDTLLPFKYDYTGAFDRIFERINKNISPLFLPSMNSSATNEGSFRNSHPLLQKILNAESDKESFLKIAQSTLKEVLEAINEVIDLEYRSHLFPSDPYLWRKYGSSGLRNLAKLYSFQQIKFAEEMKESFKDSFFHRVRV